ncbi:MAG: secretion protein [Planctomycetota bacterium]|nr:MAG: secretion protein [Planctomycetota bacterium]
MDPLIASGLAFFGVTGAVFAMAMAFGDNGSKNSIEDRLQVLAGKKPAGSDAVAVTREALVKEGMEGLAGVLRSLAERFDLRLLFTQADSPITPETFLLVSAGLGCFAGLICFLIVPQVAFVPLAAILFAVLPINWLLWRRGRRLKKFGDQLPEALALIARALRSGHSLASGLKVVCDEMQEPVSKEFTGAYEEQNLGVPLDAALKNMYKRMPNLDFKFFVTAVAIQRQSGGDLAEILDKISYVTRERQKLLGQVQALTGEGRISGLVLMLLPIAIFLAVWRVNPDYVMVLFTEPMGRKMIGVAIFLQIIGAYSIKKIIQIKV